MTAAPVYQARPVKRARATKAEVAARREALLDIIEAGRPMTVRQVFYQATVRGLVEKAESGYGKVQTDLTLMRRDGSLSYGWLADNTSWQRKPRTFNGVEEALKATAAFYRKNLWRDAERGHPDGALGVELLRGRLLIQANNIAASTQPHSVSLSRPIGVAGGMGPSIWTTPRAVSMEAAVARRCHSSSSADGET